MLAENLVRLQFSNLKDARKTFFDNALLDSE
jgi:hypothetical protein